jgi:hypothetical protein
MKRFCFLFTLLIGMMCFAGLRTETSDLKENSNTGIEQVHSTFQVEMQAISVNVSIENFSQEVFATNFLATNFFALKTSFDALIRQLEATNNYNLKSQSITFIHGYALQNSKDKERKARDGLSC